MPDSSMTRRLAVKSGTLSIKTNERLDTFAKGQIELANQIQALREENSRLRGQVETLIYELDAARKRQQDFYVDLDGRLRKLEPQAAPSTEAKPADEGKPPSIPPPGKLPAIRPLKRANTRRRSTCSGPTSSRKRQRLSRLLPGHIRTAPDSQRTVLAWQRPLLDA
jgi:hypothetical protein